VSLVLDKSVKCEISWVFVYREIGCVSAVSWVDGVSEASNRFGCVWRVMRVSDADAGGSEVVLEITPSISCLAAGWFGFRRCHSSKQSLKSAQGML